MTKQIVSNYSGFECHYWFHGDKMYFCFENSENHIKLNINLTYQIDLTFNNSYTIG